MEGQVVAVVHRDWGEITKVAVARRDLEEEGKKVEGVEEEGSLNLRWMVFPPLRQHRGGKVEEVLHCTVQGMGRVSEEPWR